MVVTLLIAQLGLLTGCEGFNVIVGTGETITRTYDFTGFSRIEINTAFEVDVTPSEVYSVSITGYENLFDYFEVSKTTDTLKIRMKHGSFTTSNPRVVITLPALTYLSISGASHGSVKGFVSSSDLTLKVIGASSLDVVMAAGKSDVEVIGASQLNGSLTTTDARVKLSGASRMDISGFTETLDIEVSGASTADMFGFTTEDVWTDVSGASTVNLTVKGTLNVQVSGASTLNYKGTPELGKMDISGASSLHKK
jgi:stage V sporulation protein SpoVS